MQTSGVMVSIVSENATGTRICVGKCLISWYSQDPCDFTQKTVWLPEINHLYDFRRPRAMLGSQLARQDGPRKIQTDIWSYFEKWFLGVRFLHCLRNPDSIYTSCSVTLFEIRILEIESKRFCTFALTGEKYSPNDRLLWNVKLTITCRSNRARSIHDTEILKWNNANIATAIRAPGYVSTTFPKT